jgi:hypothetical protein
MSQYVEPVCPRCGSGYIKEWGSVQTSYEVASVEVDDDGAIGDVNADEPSDTSWDSYSGAESYACGHCGYEEKEIDPFVKPLVERPFAVLTTSGGVIRRFPTRAEAVGFIGSITPEEARVGFYVDPSEQETPNE